MEVNRAVRDTCPWHHPPNRFFPRKAKQSTQHSKSPRGYYVCWKPGLAPPSAPDAPLDTPAVAPRSLSPGTSPTRPLRTSSADSSDPLQRTRRTGRQQAKSAGNRAGERPLCSSRSVGASSEQTQPPYTYAKQAGCISYTLPASHIVSLESRTLPSDSRRTVGSFSR
ncbi:unnamed protein product [Arctogadus glacialis]